MLDVTAENGLHVTINKNYYNDIAHINKNKRIMDAMIIVGKMDKVYTNLSLETAKTTSIEEYMNYVKKIREDWDKIWKFCTNSKIQSLELDGYVNKEKAVNRIAKEICVMIKDKNSIFPRQKKYFNEIKYNEKKDKPLLFAVGKGNGNMTISNTKGVSGKGPIKRIIRTLSKYSTVILTPEDNTSQLCNICEEQVKHVKVYKTKSKKEMRLMTEEEKMLDSIRKEYVKDTTDRVKSIKKQNKEIESMEVSNIQEKNKFERIYKKNESLKKELKRNLDNNRDIYSSSYRLVCCANKEHKHRMWERNMNASKNMIKIMKNIVIKSDKGNYKKSMKEKKKKKKVDIIVKDTIIQDVKDIIVKDIIVKDIVVEDNIVKDIIIKDIIVKDFVIKEKKEKKIVAIYKSKNKNKGKIIVIE